MKNVIGKNLIYLALIISLICTIGDAYLFIKYSSISLLYTCFSYVDKIIFIGINGLLVCMGILLVLGVILCNYLDDCN